MGRWYRVACGLAHTRHTSRFPSWCPWLVLKVMTTWCKTSAPPFSICVRSFIIFYRKVRICRHEPHQKDTQSGGRFIKTSEIVWGLIDSPARHQRKGMCEEREMDLLDHTRSTRFIRFEDRPRCTHVDHRPTTTGNSVLARE